MNYSVFGKKTIKDILKVLFSNVVKLFAGILVGFLIPKILGLTDYAYYKTFQLYATYVGIFHFGIVDGIYLKYGGIKFENIDKNAFKYYSKILFFLEIIITLIGAFIALKFLKNEYKFIFLMISVYIFCYNITGYFQTISQITERFDELSIRNIIQSCLNVISVIVLWILSKNEIQVNYRLYTSIFVFIQFLLSIWYIITYRSISFFNIKNKGNRKEIFNFIKVGLPLLISNLCLLIFLNLDRQFVNVLYPIEKFPNTYATYAFAYNLLTLITTATSAISIVLYPSLKRTKEEEVNSSYNKYVTIIISIVFICLLVYYPLCWFINWFLPKYVDSLIIFRIILPGLILSSIVTIINHNYFKILNKNIIFFMISIVILVVGFMANFLAYILVKEPYSISIASVIVLLLWYFITTIYFVVKYKVKWIKNFIFVIVSILSFYLITIIDNVYLGFLLQVIISFIIVYIFNFKNVNDFFRK